mmetsp:Transcript_16264/g.34517  ORF Transcript_16264/g.34517 Transcript_16264/m.34517 type:complete len:216 (+) Transcript_16264:53-700(+)
MWGGAGGKQRTGPETSRVTSRAGRLQRSQRKVSKSLSTQSGTALRICKYPKVSHAMEVIRIPRSPRFVQRLPTKKLQAVHVISTSLLATPHSLSQSDPASPGLLRPLSLSSHSHSRLTLTLGITLTHTEPNSRSPSPSIPTLSSAAVFAPFPASASTFISTFPLRFTARDLASPTHQNFVLQPCITLIDTSDLNDSLSRPVNALTPSRFESRTLL